MTLPALDQTLVLRLTTFGVLGCWLLLAVLPHWRFTQWLVHSIALPLVLAFLYAYLISANALFEHGLPQDARLEALPRALRYFFVPETAAAAFVHLMLFDLFVGAWEVRDARRRHMPHLLVLPCLALTLLAGPLGLLLYFVLRLATRRGGWALAEAGGGTQTEVKER
jgi:NhaP-type Na+/H+ or K+/H+ antiporter